MLRSTSHSLRRPVVALLVLTLLVAMAAAVSQPAPASAGDPGPVRVGPSTGSYYNPVAPRLQAGDQQERLGKLARGAGTAKLAPSAKVLAQADAFDRKHSAGNPAAAEVLGQLEARSAKSGKSPRAFKKAPAPRRPGCSASWSSSTPTPTTTSPASSAQPSAAPRTASPSRRARC